MDSKVLYVREEKKGTVAGLTRVITQDSSDTQYHNSYYLLVHTPSLHAPSPSLCLFTCDILPSDIQLPSRLPYPSPGHFHAPGDATLLHKRGGLLPSASRSLLLPFPIGTSDALDSALLPSPPGTYGSVSSVVRSSRLGRTAPWSLSVFRLRPFLLLLPSPRLPPSPDNPMPGYLTVQFPADPYEGRPDWCFG
ncbi:hypothetical protein NDU88_004273 [Pleurodeles waltl]|uniref:Uncharacterized protein n=1 Tax=Pleurodeles waltl TaxID=8319 RepID=A0AAV7M9G2_PLEWA|nr:hypothetical protein NDU88_004273 [Pleurodeles waltl]